MFVFGFETTTTTTTSRTICTCEVRKDVFDYGARRVALGASMRVLQRRLYAVLTEAVTALGHVRHIDDVEAYRTRSTSGKN